jgi:putative peptide zinc metalloprotease protein
MLPSDTRVAIPHYVERADGDDVIVGNPARNCFLAVPPDAAALLRWLASGCTVGEASAAYEQQFASKPDIDDFLTSLTEQGFLSVGMEQARTGHLERISLQLAQRLCNWPTAVIGAAIVALGAAACVTDPSILPTPTSLVFEHDQLGLAVGVALLTLVTVFFHELAHLIAARAANVPSRMGVGNRLWVLVAETDMTGIWLASRVQRCIAFLAGPAFDLVLAALLMLVLAAAKRNWIELEELPLVLLRATTFVVLTRLLWQFYFFLATDLYYVLMTLCGCKNLMQDTHDYLINQLARFTRSVRPIDQSGVPPREMRVVRWFAVVWMSGRGLAFASLFLITLPVLGGYAAMLGRGLVGDDQAMRPFLEGPPLVVLAVALQSIGLLAWLRSLVLNRRPA